MLRASHRFPLAQSVEMPDEPTQPQASLPPDPEPPPPEPRPVVTCSTDRCKLALVPIREHH
jgi:hypothetical protein